MFNSFAAPVRHCHNEMQPLTTPHVLYAQLQCEIKIHRTLHHDRIVKFERFFEDRVNAYMVLELCTNQVRQLVVHFKNACR